MPPWLLRLPMYVLIAVFWLSTVSPGTPKPTFPNDPRSASMNAILIVVGVTPRSLAVKPGTGALAMVDPTVGANEPLPPPPTGAPPGVATPPPDPPGTPAAGPPARL